MGECCYWRFIKASEAGDRSWAIAWPCEMGLGLIRMGAWIGDKYSGPIVDPNEIEVRQE